MRLQNGDVFAILGQTLQKFVVHINFTSYQELNMPGTLIPDPCHLNIPLNPVSVSLLGSTVKTVVLVDDGMFSNTLYVFLLLF